MAKVKAVEKDAKIKHKITREEKSLGDIEWSGEEIETRSTTKIQDDKGEGIPIVLRFFDFGANIKTFKEHKPTAQELFNSHMRGIETLLWRDGLKPYDAIEPRLMFSKDKRNYRFIVACLPSSAFTGNTQTLSQLLNDTPANPN